MADNKEAGRVLQLDPLAFEMICSWQADLEILVERCFTQSQWMLTGISSRKGR